MPMVTDTTRIAIAHTPLGDKLVFREMTGREELSRAFLYQVVLLAENDSGVDPKALLGQGITIELEIFGGGRRYIDGQCVRFSYIGTEVAQERTQVMYRYMADVRPWTWYMTCASDCYIFQNITVPDIVREVCLRYGYPFVFRLTRTYRAWEYCVQYQETDFNFISRLLEHEGICYFFEHSMGAHTLVFADDIGAYSTLPGYASIPYIAPDTVAMPDEEYIDYWNMSQEVASGRFVTRDYNFETPSSSLEVIQKASQQRPPDSRLETFDWPGGYRQDAEGQHYAKTRIEELEQPQETVSGQSTARGLTPGYLFTLTRCPRRDQNREYLLISVNSFLRDNSYLSGTYEPADWRFSIVAQPSVWAYRPARTTPKPRTTGPQTAVVVGPPDEEIYTDEYGRVKVQFHWDRYGKADQNAGCWIRVSSSWAGSNWGQISLPRIGQEVIVDFLNGDPDYPIIIGRLYNAEHKPPYVLPKWKEYSTTKSRSTKKGGNNDWNEIRFYDYKGKEQVFIQAQWRMDVRVKWNKYLTVKESWHSLIGHGYYLTTGGNLEQYVKGDTYERTDGKVSITAGGKVEVVAESGLALSSDSKIEVYADSKIVIESQSEITLKVGSNFVKVDMMGVTIQGTMVKINSGGSAGSTASFDAEHPQYASEADDGEPGYLDKPKKGGGWAKRKSSRGGGGWGGGSSGGASSATTPAARLQVVTPLDSPDVKKGMAKAWTDSQAGDKDKRHEEGGYIVKNADGTYGVERWPTGKQATIAPPPRSADGKYKGKEVVGEFHTHPNPDVDEKGKKWQESPSPGDLTGIKAEKYAGDSYVIGHKNVYSVGNDGTDKGKIGKREDVLK